MDTFAEKSDSSHLGNKEFSPYSLSQAKNLLSQFILKTPDSLKKLSIYMLLNSPKSAPISMTEFPLE